MSELNLNDAKTEYVAEIITQHRARPIDTLLVVGCGSGLEAAILADRLNTKVYGIDICDEFDAVASSLVTLKLGDAMNMEFDDNSFDFVYSYHSLEHIEDPIRALTEISRVLKPQGGYWIGTPNRHRVIGYLGSKDASLRDKLNWNLQDWRARLVCQFRNEFGAHAGFSQPELAKMLGNVFSSVSNVSDIYFEGIYPSHIRIIRLLKFFRLTSILYPSIYFLGSN